jgi:hypothetical protein
MSEYSFVDAISKQVVLTLQRAGRSEECWTILSTISALEKATWPDDGDGCVEDIASGEEKGSKGKMLHR